MSRGPIPARPRLCGRPPRRLGALLVVALSAAALAASPASSPAHADESAQPPARPTGLTVDTELGSLDAAVDWDDVAGADDYLVRWRLSGPGNPLNDGVRPTSSHTDITVADDGSWVVRVQACNNAGCSAAAAQRFTVEPAPEPAPTTTTTTTTTTAPPATTTTVPPATTTTVPVSLSVAVSASATEVTVGEAVSLSAAVTGAPGGQSPAYRWEMDYGGGGWFTVDTSAVFSYIGSSPESPRFRVTVSYGSGASAVSDPLSVSFVNPPPEPEPAPEPEPKEGPGRSLKSESQTPQTPVSPPAKPTGLEAVTFAGMLSLGVDWDDVAGADDYLVQWRPSGPGQTLNTGLRPAVSVATITVASAGRWVVRVRACNTAGCSAPAAVSFDVDGVALPGPVSGYDAATTAGSLDVTLSWDAATGADSYTLNWQPFGAEEFDTDDTLDTTSTSAAVTVDAYGTWVFQLEACNTVGCGPGASFTADVEDELVAMEFQTGTTDYDTDNDALIEIANAAQLNAIRWNLNGDGTTVASGDQANYLAAFVDAASGMGCPASGCKGYELTTDVNLSAYPNWVPIGTYTATLEGNGHTVANLTIDSSVGSLGLFATLGSTAEVRNLELTGVDITVRPAEADVNSVGVLAALNQGLVEAVHTTGTVTCERPNISTFRCQQVGGVIGENTGTSSGPARIQRSSSAVHISGPNNDAGGLVGLNGGSTTLRGIVQASYATGDVSGRENVGGLVGFNYPGGEIEASYSVGGVSAVTAPGGLVGFRGGGTVTASYYNSETAGQSDNLGRGVPKTTAELAAPTGYSGIYAGWNLDLDNADNDNNHSTGGDNPWRFGTADQYPGLVDGSGVVRRPIDPTDYDTDDDGLIEIANAAQLNAIRWNLNGDGTTVASGDQANYRLAFGDAPRSMGCPASGCKGYELTADIDLASYTNWSPIGDMHSETSCRSTNRDHCPYRAIFEGNGHVVKNLTVDQTAAKIGTVFTTGNSLGLFAELHAEAVARNLGLTNASITGRSSAGPAVDAFGVGVLAGRNVGTVEAAWSTGTVTSFRPPNGGSIGAFGGLVGTNYGEIRRSHSTVSISDLSTPTARVTSAGGLVGGNYSDAAIGHGVIKASWAAGDVSAQGRAGGLAGTSDNTASIIASYSIGTVTVHNTNTPRGGLVGSASTTVTASYYNSETQTPGQPDTGKGVAKTTAELAAPTCYCGIYAGWNLDFDGGAPDRPWRFGTSQQYPGLADVRGVVHRPAFPGVVSAVGRGSTLALVYSEALDEDSTPAAADFSVTVMRQGAEDRSVEVRSVRVAGRSVTLSLASSVSSAGQTVTVSYTKGTTNPIVGTSDTKAADLSGYPVTLAAPQVRAAVVSRTASPWTMTVDLDQPGLQGSYVSSAWSVRADGGSPVRPVGGSVDSDAGTVTLTLPSTLAWDDTLTVSYRQSGGSSRLRNAAGSPIASFTYNGTTWTKPPNAACTLGPGGDPRNPDSPCGYGPEDISTTASAYKSLHLMNQSELTDPPEPDSVAIACSSANNRDCVISWERPCTDSDDFVVWSKCRHWPEGYSESFVYNAYLFADLNRSSTCTTRSILVDRFPGLKPAETQTRSDFDLDPPTTLPAGCTIKRWTASVVIEQGTVGGKTSGAALARRLPSLASNAGQAAASGAKPNFTMDHAVGFTTGSHTGGYTLARADLEISSAAGSSAEFTVDVYEASGSLPGATNDTKVGTLHAVPRTSGRFTGSVNLDPDTDYYLVIDVSTHTQGAGKTLEFTASANDDTGGLAGWNIHSDRYQRTHTTTTWQTTDQQATTTLKIALYGQKR